jgi:hypothetical protein
MLSACRRKQAYLNSDAKHQIKHDERFATQSRLQQGSEPLHDKSGKQKKPALYEKPSQGRHAVAALLSDAQR